MTKIEMCSDGKLGYWEPCIEGTKMIERTPGEYPMVDERRFAMCGVPDDCLDLIVKWQMTRDGVKDFVNDRGILLPVTIRTSGDSPQEAVSKVEDRINDAAVFLKAAGATDVVMVWSVSDSCVDLLDDGKWQAECCCGIAGCVKG